MSTPELGRTVDGVLEPRAVRFHLPVVALTGLVWLLLLLGQLRWIHVPVSLGAQDGLFVLFGLVTVWVGLGCQVPLQNIVGATAVIGGFSLAMEILNARTGFPFGRIQYTDGIAGPRVGGVPWIVPVFWVMAVVWARGFARVLLVKQRLRSWYGYALLFLAAALVVLLDFEWQRLAGRAMAIGCGRWIRRSFDSEGFRGRARRGCLRRLWWRCLWRFRGL